MNPGTCVADMRVLEFDSVCNEIATRACRCEVGECTCEWITSSLAHADHTSSSSAIGSVSLSASALARENVCKLQSFHRSSTAGKTIYQVERTRDLAV